MTSKKHIKCVAKCYMEFYILCCAWLKLILSLIIPNDVWNTESVLEHILFYSQIHRNFTSACYHINMSYWICFFSHVRVDVNMCLMCKDYRFIPFYCIYAIAVRAGFEIFFISFSYLILFTGLLHHKDLSACLFFIKQGPMVEQSRLNGTPCINILEIKNVYII